MSKVSILIPCYNAEQWIAEAIQSALNQTYSNKEVIVVDDGSNDGSLEMIKSFGDQIVWESGPNRGGNVARNRLLELASGEWLQYLDADDYLLPEKIENQIDRVKKSGKKIDVVYSPPLIETWNKEEVEGTQPSVIDFNIPLELQWIRWQVAQTGTVLWCKESLEKIGGWNEDFPCCQDNEVTLRAMMAGLNFLPTSEAEAVYRIWSEETVCRKVPTRVIEYKTKLIDCMLEWLSCNHREIFSEAKQVAGQACFEMARTIARSSIPDAVDYRKDRMKQGVFLSTGPAATKSFRLTQALVGFGNAERIARWVRS